ncbi:MAG: helix-hairpin-helix domain-containing protein [Bacteroides sp.]|nr:helix-hairpin-helix domain-containing protein [Bacteroides sp.]
MKTFFKEFLYFNRRERRGILVLVILMLLVFLGGMLYRQWQYSRPLPPDSLQRQAEAMKEYRAFVASVEQLEESLLTARRNSYINRWESRNKESAVLLHPFDPNTADSATLRQLGLPGWMARNVVRYREKGGIFRRPEDFKKIYGLNETEYLRLLPYIRITAEEAVRSETPPLLVPTQPADTLPLSPPKYAAGTVVCLNSADTTELKRIPGIGSTIARMIVGYRRKLGGFYSLEQLGEINLDYRQLQPWFSVETDSIHTLDANRLSVDRLRMHPYINFYQARAIVELRRKMGRLDNLKSLSLLEEFSETDLERLQHYLRFD